MSNHIAAIKAAMTVADVAAEAEPAPFVPKVDPIPPVVDRFFGIADRQYQQTYDLLLNSAARLEAKAAELRRRADQVLVDLHSMKDTITQAVKYEDECRHVANSLSMISLKEGE